MNNEYFLLLIVLLIIIIATIINNTDLNILPEKNIDFCTDFSNKFNDCECVYNESLFNFNEKIINSSIAEQKLKVYANLFNIECNNSACFNILKGEYYYCYCNNDFIGTMNDKGEFYFTKCGN